MSTKAPRNTVHQKSDPATIIDLEPIKTTANTTPQEPNGTVKSEHAGASAAATTTDADGTSSGTTIEASSPVAERDDALSPTSGQPATGSLESLVAKENAELQKPMTKTECNLRNQYVDLITAASTNMIIANAALGAIRQLRLWRGTHPSFEAFCREVVGISEARASQLIAAANQHASLKDKVAPELLPSTESAYRVLQRVDADRKPEVLQLAVKLSNLNRPTASAIEEAWKTLSGESESHSESTSKPARPAQAIKSTKNALEHLQKVDRNQFTLSELEEMRTTVKEFHDTATKIIKG